MPNKRGHVSKRPRKNSKMTLKRTLEEAITSNPFLNFFLSKCRVKGNAKLHRFAKRAGVQWRDMSYKEKTPYYLMADKAKSKYLRRKSKKRRFSESDIGEPSASTIKVLKKPDSNMSNENSRDKKEVNSTKEDAAKNIDHERRSEDLNASVKMNNDADANDVSKTEATEADGRKERRHKHGRWKRVSGSSVEISSCSTSFHSMNSEDYEQKSAKPKRKKIRSFSWTDSFDYMN